MPGWSEAFVEGSLDWQFLKHEDLPELAELRLAIEYFDDPTERRSLSDLEEDFGLPESHADAHAVVGRDKGGTIVAYGWNHPTSSRAADPHVWLETGVHPAWRHQRIGQRLIDWSIERARMWWRHIQDRNEDSSSVWIGCAVDEGSRQQEDILENGLLHPQRWFFDMHSILQPGELPTAELAPEVELVPYRDDLREAARQAHNEAFATMEGAHAVTPEAWQQSLVRPEFRPAWSWLALERGSGDVVGYALNSELVDPVNAVREGWTERIGVLPGYRTHGVGSALLTRSMASFVDAGCSLAGVGVDTDDPSHAEALFTALGYSSDTRMVLYGARFTD